MRIALSALLLLIPCLIPVLAHSQESDWMQPLEGKELGKHCTTKGNWKLEEGVATLTPRPGESGWTRYDAYLWINGEYKDFEAEFEYKVEKGGNSGFYFHVGDVKEPVATGIEVQIYDSGSKKPGDKLTDHDSGGVIPGLPPTKSAAKPAGEWNKFSITSKGDKVTIVLNGVTVNEVSLTSDQLKPSDRRDWFSGPWVTAGAAEDSDSEVVEI